MLAAVEVSLEVATLYLAATVSVGARENFLLACFIMNSHDVCVGARLSTQVTLVLPVGAVFLQMFLKLSTNDIGPPTPLWAGDLSAWALGQVVLERSHSSHPLAITCSVGTPHLQIQDFPLA